MRLAGLVGTVLRGKGLRLEFAFKEEKRRTRSPEI